MVKSRTAVLATLAAAQLLVLPAICVAQTSGSETSMTPALTKMSSEVFLAGLAPTLGNEPASRLEMKFEVTFMKIDVAQLEAADRHGGAADIREADLRGPARHGHVRFDPERAV